MTVSPRPLPLLGAPEALERIAARAGEADAGARDLSEDIADLRVAGILQALTQPVPPRDQATLLRRIGRASLSVGRLAEGHMNALALIRLYATPEQRQRHEAAARAALYGVWGAERDDPARIVAEHAGRVRLAGAKTFASGLGLVATAVVTVGGAEATRLVLAPATDPDRADVSGWRTTGMRATASGTFDLDGIDGELLGDAGEYEREPHFQGGIWRYAALHVGGLEALAEAARMAVARDPREASLHRLARITARAHAARLMVEAAAEAVAHPGAGNDAVALSLLAREHVEEACLDGIALVDRMLGTRAFAVGTPVERIRRDLAFFLRQADLDGKLTLAGRLVSAADGPIGELWGRH